MVRGPEEHRCYCQHGSRQHVRRTGRCVGTDSYGLACECVGFEHSDSCMDFDDIPEEDRPALRPDPEPHYRRLVEDNGRVDPEEEHE